MRVKIVESAFVAVLFCICFLGISIAHPADGFQPKELPVSYDLVGMSLPYSLSFGDVQFPEEHIAITSLSDAEIYVLAGSTGSSLGHSLGPWHKQICSIGAALYKNTGSIPQMLNEDLIRNVTKGDGANDPDLISLYRSPVSGSFPALTANYFSPGDAYIKVLSDSDINQLAQQNEMFRMLFVEKVQLNPNSGIEQPIEFLEPPMYFRFYGDDGVLIANLRAIWRFVE